MSTKVTQGRDTERPKRPRSADNTEIHKLAVQNAELQLKLRESERQNRKLEAEVKRLKADQCLAVFGGFYTSLQWVQ